VLAVLFVADFVGDKVPAVDSVLHAVGAVVHPAAGAIVFAGETGVATEVPAVIALLAGALISGSLHATRAGVRPVSTVGTAGVGNPVLSLAEDVGAVVLCVVAVVLPLLAFLLVLGLLLAVALSWRALRRRLAHSGSEER